MRLHEAAPKLIIQERLGDKVKVSSYWPVPELTRAGLALGRLQLHSSLGKILFFIIHEVDKFLFLLFRHSLDSSGNTTYGVKVAVFCPYHGSIIDHTAEGFIDLRSLLPLRAVLSDVSLERALEASSFLMVLLLFCLGYCLLYVVDIHGIGVKGRGATWTCLSSLSSIPGEGFSLHLVILLRRRWGITAQLSS